VYHTLRMCLQASTARLLVCLCTSLSARLCLAQFVYLSILLCDVFLRICEYPSSQLTIISAMPRSTHSISCLLLGVPSSPLSSRLPPVSSPSHSTAHSMSMYCLALIHFLFSPPSALIASLSCPSLSPFQFLPSPSPSPLFLLFTPLLPLSLPSLLPPLRHAF
jgi:hypothetical protein